MNVYRANLLHAVFTMVCATYIYYTTGDKLIVLLIVVAVMLLSLNNGVQHGVTSQIKAALGVSWLGAILLYRPIDVAFANGRIDDMIEVIPMLVSLAIFTFYAIKSFRK